MSNQIEKTLKLLGLNDKEISIYISLLSLGNAPASVLGKRTGITRSTAQYTCQQLVKKGLIIVVEKNNTFVYTPENPDKILFLLEQQKKEVEEKKTMANRIIGDLKNMINPNITLPKVRFFEGKDGIISLYDKILDIDEPIYSMEDKGEMVSFFPQYVEKWIRERVKRKIPIKVVSPSKNPININDSEKDIEVRHIDRDLYPTSCDIKICGDQVSVISFEENNAAGISIRHKDIADNFRVIFDFFWNNTNHNSSSKEQDIV